MKLNPLRCYAKIANVDAVFKHEFSYLNLPTIVEEFVAKEMTLMKLPEEKEIQAILPFVFKIDHLEKSDIECVIEQEKTA